MQNDPDKGGRFGEGHVAGRSRWWDNPIGAEQEQMDKPHKPEGHLTPDGILDAAETVLRRFGPKKASVVDVARALGVSHGSIYRHFPSKKALRDAVAGRWLAGRARNGKLTGWRLRQNG